MSITGFIGRALLSSLFITGHDPLTQLLFLFEGQQGRSADLPQVTLQSIKTFRSTGFPFSLIGCAGRF